MFGSGASDRLFYESFEKHALVTVEATRLLAEMFGDITKAAELARRVSDLEHAGDKITHETIARLHKTWITPLDRADIRSLITALDDVLDLTEAVSERVVLFEIDVVPDDARQLSGVLVESSGAVAQAVKLLPNLKQKDLILKLCVEINRLENQADQLYRHALADLYRENKRPPSEEGVRPNSNPPAHKPLEILKWRDLYDNLESATDRCEDVANIIEGVVLEYG
jgi:predicted phosphate transport protein (TIGR00153 family)